MVSSIETDTRFRSSAKAVSNRSMRCPANAEPRQWNLTHAGIPPHPVQGQSDIGKSRHRNVPKSIARCKAGLGYRFVMLDPIRNLHPHRLFRQSHGLNQGTALRDRLRKIRQDNHAAALGIVIAQSAGLFLRSPPVVCKLGMVSAPSPLVGASPQRAPLSGQPALAFFAAAAKLSHRMTESRAHTPRQHGTNGRGTRPACRTEASPLCALLTIR